MVRQTNASLFDTCREFVPFPTHVRTQSSVLRKHSDGTQIKLR